MTTRVQEKAAAASMNVECKTPYTGKSQVEEQDGRGSDGLGLVSPLQSSKYERSFVQYISREEQSLDNKKICVPAEDSDDLKESIIFLTVSSDSSEDLDARCMCSVTEFQTAEESTEACKAKEVPDAAEVMQERRTSKKSSEGFVSWKEPHNESALRNVSRATQRPGMTGRTGSTLTSSNTMPIPSRVQGPPPLQGCRSSSMSPSKQQSHNGGYRRPAGSDGPPFQQEMTSSRGPPEVHRSGEGGPHRRPPSLHIERQTPRTRESSVRQKSTNTMEALQQDEDIGSSVHRSISAVHVQNVAFHSKATTTSAPRRHSVSDERVPAAVVSPEGVNIRAGNSNVTGTDKEEEEYEGSAYAEDDNTNKEVIADEVNVDRQYPLHGDSSSRSESEEERGREGEHDEGSGDQGEHTRGIVSLEFESESTKRRERRQAQAMREREGRRRRKEGLPRNFLLVDEFTQKPYGVGVGEWRKEVMLLSRNLDPSVGNINQHPAGAVAEIAEWIQHTWEYSSPIRFECVKEVVARGVALRRSDIWKKIRNNESKPDDVSDRAWRTLGKQLQSPATVRKMESCSRANASRVNFGRTGPSGEVGVRERLRKWLRRSPDPEEISFEMGRNKGYSGQSRTKKEGIHIMHGSGPLVPVSEDLNCMRGIASISRNAKSAKGIEHGHAEDGFQGGNLHVTGDGGDGTALAEGSRLPMTEEQILKHPLVLNMMQRLQALEGQRSGTTVDHMNASSDAAGSTQKQNVGHDVQGDVENDGLKEADFTDRLGRQRKKRRQGGQ